jgi:hypothetical protein
MLPQVAGPASTGPDAYLVAPSSGLTDELRWEGSASPTLRAYTGCLGRACLATAGEPNAALQDITEQASHLLPGGAVVCLVE